MERIFSFIGGVLFTVIVGFILLSVPTIQNKIVDFVNNAREQVEQVEESSDSDTLTDGVQLPGSLSDDTVLQ